MPRTEPEPEYSTDNEVEDQENDQDSNQGIEVDDEDNQDSNQGSNQGSNYGSNHGSNHGSDVDDNHSSNHGSNYGSNHGSNHDSDVDNNTNTSNKKANNSGKVPSKVQNKSSKVKNTSDKSSKVSDKVPDKVPDKVSSKLENTSDKSGKLPDKAPSNVSVKVPSNASKDKKEKSADAIKYDLIWDNIVNLPISIMQIDEFKQKAIQTKLTDVMTLYIYEMINCIQNINSKSTKVDVYPFPVEKYITLSEKLVKPDKTNKKTINLKESPPKKPINIKNKLRTAAGEESEDEESENSESEVEVDIDGEDEVDLNNQVEQVDQVDQVNQVDQVDQVNNSKQSDTTDSKSKRVSIVSFNSTAKTGLLFIIMRFMYEINRILSKKSKKIISGPINTPQEFHELVIGSVSTNLTSHISRHIVLTVDRLGKSIPKINDHIFHQHIGSKILNSFSELGRTDLGTQISSYIKTYFQIMAMVLAEQLWVSHRVLNIQSIMAAMRVMNIGNANFTIPNFSGNMFDIRQGFLLDMMIFNNHMNPPMSQEEKERRQEITKKKKEEKVKIEETNTPVEEVKQTRTSKKSK